MTSATPIRLLLAALAGIAVGSCVLGPDYLLGISARVRFPTGDQAQALAGGLRFIRDEWRLPLLECATLGPQGGNIAYSDSVPIAALAAKLVRGWLGPAPSYLGPWIAVCFALQAAVFAQLVGRLSDRSLPTAILAGIGATLVPVFPLRIYMEHLGLAGHFIVLGALALWFLAPGRPVLRSLSWATLLILSLLVHPYFTGMVLIFFVFRLIADLSLAKPRFGLRHAFAHGMCVMGGLSLALVAFGHVEIGAPSHSGSGYGVFSLNLLSPLATQGLSALLPATDFDGTGAQGFEGYTYPGAGYALGIALLAAFGLRSVIRAHRAGELTALRGSVFEKVWRNRWLASALATCLLFALSHRVYAGQHLVLRLPLLAPFDLMGRYFRASGRFAWPAVYVTVLAVFVGILRTLPPFRARVLLALLIAIQLLDIRPILERADNPILSIASEPPWRTLATAHERIDIHPPRPCQWTAGGSSAAVGFELLAAFAGASVNHASTARDHPDCSAAASELWTATTEPGRLVLLLSPDVGMRDLLRSALDPHSCRSFSGGLACTEAWPMLRDASLQELFTPLPITQLANGEATEVSLAHDGSGVRLLERGWAEPGKWGVWTEGPEATLELPGSVRPATGNRIEVRVRGFVPPGSHALRVEVFADGDKIDEWRFGQRERPSWKSLTLPETQHADAGPVLLRFRIRNPRSPAEIGLSVDNRRLGVHLQRIRLHPRSQDRGVESLQ